MQEFHFTGGLCETGSLLLRFPPHVLKDQFLKQFSKEKNVFVFVFRILKKNKNLFIKIEVLEFFPQHLFVWVSLTYIPEHTGRQCRNFTFPESPKHDVPHCYCCTPPCICTNLHYSMHRLNMHMYMYMYKFTLQHAQVEHVHVHVYVQIYIIACIG